MTRRKQDAPKRLESLGNSHTSVSGQRPVDSRLVISDSGTENGEGGETSSAEEPICDMHVDAPSGLPYVLASRLVGQQRAGCSHCVAGHSCNDDASDSNNGEVCMCHIYGSCQGGGRENRRSKTFSAQRQHTSDLSNLTEEFRSSKPFSDCGSCCSIRQKKSKKNSISSISQSAALTSGDVAPEMALVMSSSPVGLFYGVHNHMESGMTSSTQDQQDDQPLDLSRKAARSASFSSTETELVVLRNRSCSDSTASTPPLPTNAVSSLQSLQRRFGDDVPLHPSHGLAAVVIPLPANVTCQSAINPNGLWSAGDVPPSTGLIKSRPLPQVGPSEEHCVTEASAGPPLPQGESNRQASPGSGDESVGEGWSKHTTHRCSCQSTFSTLYSLSLHLQETGHTPSSSKGSSPADYPKLVRGQDMWLNQESEQTRRILRCIQCGESFRSLPQLTVHMMQTQHYTTIVNSDHGRRPHKCSTYCGRELDQGCIFKCKVCQEAFGDMGRLASHMVISGHHKKQWPRHVANPATVSGDVSATARQRKRKRCLQDDNLSAAVPAGSFTVASLLNYRRKENGVGQSEVKDSRPELEACGESSSPETVSAGLVICDVCGENVAALCFNSHVQECPRQRAELMKTLRNKLTLEEAHLSRSEGKPLKPNFSLPSATHRQKSTQNSPLTDRARTESVCSEVQEAECIKDYEGSISENCSHQHLEMSPVRSCSLPSSDLTQMVRLSASPSAKRCASPSARFSTSPRLNDLHEVPHKKWCSDRECQQDVNKDSCGTFVTKDDDNWPVNSKNLSGSPTINQQCVACVEYKNIDQNTLNEEVSYIKSEQCHVDDDRRDYEMDIIVHALSEVEERHGRLTPPNHVTESTLESSLDCTYSALHKLDLFSRGLNLSSPRRIISLESKLPVHQPPKVPKKKESLPTKIRSPMSKSSSSRRSPQTVASSPLPHLTSESPSPSKVNMAFDIIDPNVDPRGTASAPSALEAMASFINKSFSAKPERCSPGLTSMFSPFINCFPNPGSVLPPGGMLLDPSNATTSHFAKFSRFFGMVPGIPVYSEMASSHAIDKTKTNMGNCRVDTTNLAAMLALSEYHLGTLSDKIFALNKGTVAINPITSFPSVKVPVGRYELELPADGTICQGDNNSRESSVEIVSAFKKQNHQIDSSPESLNAQKNHKFDSSIDRLTAQNNHKFGLYNKDEQSLDYFIAEKKHKYGNSDYMVAEKNHKFGSSPDHFLAQTIGHDHCKTADKISGNMEIHCTDDNVSQRLRLIEPLYSSSQTPPHVEPFAVELERKRSKEPKLHLWAVSSKRIGVRFDDIQQDGELVTAVKSEAGEKDMWEDDHVVTNDEKVTDVAEAPKSKVNINSEKNKVDMQLGNSKVNTELENGKVNVELKERQVDMVIQNNNIYSQFEKTKLTSQTEVDKSKVKIEQNSFSVNADESKVDKSMIVKTENKCSFDEGNQILETNFLNPNQHKSTATNLKLFGNIEHKMYINPEVVESKQDEFKKHHKYEAWLNSGDEEREMYSSTNKRVNKRDVFVQDDIQKEACKAVFSENICRDIQTRSSNESFCKDHFHERSRLNSCSNYKPDSQHKNGLVKVFTPGTKCTLAEQESVPAKPTALFGDTNSDNCDNFLPDENSCRVFDVNVDADNNIDEQVDNNIDEQVDNNVDEQVDEVASDTSRENIHKGRCKEEVELNVENIEDHNVTSGASQNVNVVSINNRTYLENSKNGIDRIECASSGKCGNETELEFIHSDNNVYSGTVKKQSTDVERVNGGHVMNKSMSTHLIKTAGFDCELIDSPFISNQSFVQSVKILTNVKSEHTEEITLQTGIVKEEIQYIQKNLQKRTNHGTTMTMKNCLSESETNMNTNEMDRQKQRKSALDYLSSFVYNQPLSTEHPLDNLQRLLATNDLTGLPTDHDQHLVNTSHKCCSADTFAQQSTISRSGQVCGSYSTSDNEDDESFLTESGMGEGDIHEHRCVGCRRRFASKGSYRYHLSRCHLSNAKKYSIKETFSQSPYVYLPLDHTVKLSKYYQMTQKLSHEGK